MFAKMRAALGIAKTIDILDHVYTLAPDLQAAAMESIRNVEREAMVKMVPQRGLLPLMEYLQKKGVQKAICTRNFESVSSQTLFFPPSFPSIPPALLLGDLARLTKATWGV